MPSRHSKLARVALLVTMCGLACSAQGPAADSGALLGPAPRDGSGRFRNFAHPLDLAGPSVTLPFFARRVLGRFRGLPEGLPEQEPEAKSRLQSRAAEAEATVTWVNHASLLVRMDGLTILTDPCRLSNCVRRRIWHRSRQWRGVITPLLSTHSDGEGHRHAVVR